MPTYKVVELSPDQREVYSAAIALDACDSPINPEALIEFTGLPKTRVNQVIRTLKAMGLFAPVRSK